MSTSFDLTRFQNTSFEEYDFEHCFTRMYPNNGMDEIDVAAAIYHTFGSYGPMGALLGRPRSQVQIFVLRNDFLRNFREEMRQTRLDEIEEKAYDNALAGDASMQRFFLTTIGKDRGYVQKTETEVNERPRKKLDFSSMPDELLERMMTEIDNVRAKTIEPR